MKLTNYFLKKKIATLAAEAPRRKHGSCSLREAKDVLVMYDAADAAEMKSLLDALAKEKLNVHACIYGAPSDRTKAPDGALFVDPNKLSVLGFPKPSVVTACHAIPADLLIDLTSSASLPMHYLMLQHPSPFKIGLKYGRQTLHDFSICVTDRKNISQLSEILLHYLKDIHTK